MDIPGNFGLSSKKQKSGHEHNKDCYHPLVVGRPEEAAERSREACAAAQLLNGLPPTINERFVGEGTLPRAVQQGKTTVAQVLVPAAITSGRVHGLTTALGNLLRVPRSWIEFAIRKRGDRTSETMNAEMAAGLDTERRVRADRYDRWHIYNFFHHLGDSPDYCSLVEPDKSKRSQWKAKKWNLGGEDVLLNCQPHVRRGTKATLVQHYRNSETAARYAPLLHPSLVFMPPSRLSLYLSLSRPAGTSVSIPG